MPKRTPAVADRLVPEPPGPSLRLPDGESRDIPPANLLLDPGNLRLYDVARNLQTTSARLIGQASVQDKLQQLLLDEPRFDIKSLIVSIVSNGFLKHDRLIVARYAADQYLTLEGNRRLCAIRAIQAKDFKPPLNSTVRASLVTLPCFVLDGDVIGGSEEGLAKYRRASEIYIGIRHLMGARSWDPASRYEFQARLIRNEGWTPEQVAERFGRNKNDVIREVQAQQLYQDFVSFERNNKLSHTLTYNAFAEAVRARAISEWLGWSKKSMQIGNRQNEQTFFRYLISRLQLDSRHTADDDEVISSEESAEGAVRRLRDMLKLEDEDVTGALSDGQFDTAELLFEDRRTGAFAKRLSSYIRSLRRIPVSELIQNRAEHKRLLDELIAQAQNLRDLLLRRTPRT